MSSKPKTTLAAADAVKAAPAPHSDFDDLPDSALVRESRLVKSPKRPGVHSLLPISSPTLWRLVRANKFPKPIRLTGRITCWRVGQVREWLNSQAQA